MFFLRCPFVDLKNNMTVTPPRTTTTMIYNRRRGLIFFPYFPLEFHRFPCHMCNISSTHSLLEGRSLTSRVMLPLPQQGASDFLCCCGVRRAVKITVDISEKSLHVAAVSSSQRQLKGQACTTTTSTTPHRRRHHLQVTFTPLGA